MSASQIELVDPFFFLVVVERSGKKVKFITCSVAWPILHYGRESLYIGHARTRKNIIWYSKETSKTSLLWAILRHVNKEMADHKRKIPTLHYEITSYQTDFLPTYLVPISHRISIYEFLAIIMKSGSYLTRRYHHEVRKLPSKVIWAPFLRLTIHLLISQTWYCLQL